MAESVTGNVGYPAQQPSRRVVLASVAGLGLVGLGGRHRPSAPRIRPRAAAALSNPQLAGQRVISSYPGLTPPQSLFNDIIAGQTAGVIFFGENISSDSQIAGVITQLRQAQAQSPINVPLLLMTDQEGGEVRRLPGAPTLSEKQIGQSSDPVAAATAAGTGAGQNLAGVGMNVNLAPVLDVFYKSGNFIDQFQRSYSHNPAVASECGQAFNRLRRPLPRWQPRLATASSTRPRSTPQSTVSPHCAPGCSDQPLLRDPRSSRCAIPPIPLRRKMLGAGRPAR